MDDWAVLPKLGPIIGRAPSNHWPPGDPSCIFGSSASLPQRSLHKHTFATACVAFVTTLSHSLAS